MGLQNSINNIIHLSCRFGTDRLHYAFKDWCTNQEYDFIIGVDVGGDILAHHKSKTVLSPIMDWTALHILRRSNIRSYILEFGFGLDGESEGTIDNCPFVSASREGLMVDITRDFMDNFAVNGENLWTKCMVNFSCMYENVMKPVRSGHTVPLFIEKSKLPKEKFEPFPIPHGYKYRVDGKTIIEDNFTRNGLHHPLEAFLIPVWYVPEKMTREGYINPVEYVARLKSANPEIATEIDGHSYELGENRILFAPISKRLAESDRKKFIDAAYASFRENHDTIVLFSSDMLTCDRPILNYKGDLVQIGEPIQEGQNDDTIVPEIV